jgi:hypothetical protein
MSQIPHLHHDAVFSRHRPIVLDWAEEYLEGLEIRSTDRSPGNGNFMAAHTIQTILVELVAGKKNPGVRE